METTAGTKLNPTLGHMIAGVEISRHIFLARVPVTQLFQIAPDPRETEQRRKIDGSKELQDLFEIRREVQRLFEGAKTRNVPSYASYIVNLHRGADGITPPIILYSEALLASEADEFGKGFIQVPFDARLVAIDGETQLAARFEAANLDPTTKQQVVAIYLCHGKDKTWARQSFHDLNVLSVKPNAALSIGMDARDPLTSVARTVEQQVPFFSGRVNTMRRQLRASDKHIVTITTLRGACVTLAEGIAGVKYGARPVHVPADRLPMIEAVAVEWLTAVTKLLGTAMENREHKLAATSAVLAAIGAMGHELTRIDDVEARQRTLHSQLAKLQGVDWRRAKHWEGIAGKFTPKGRFSVGGSKETAYAVYEALNDPSSPAYMTVRSGSAAAAE